MGVEMNRSGPIIDGRAVAVMRVAEQQIEREIAEFAEAQVRDRLGRVLKHPTGYYQSQIRSHQVGSFWQVDDNNVLYGPWLESGKNRRATRFRGYFTFRRAAQLVNRRSGEIANRIMRRYLGRLG